MQRARTHERRRRPLRTLRLELASPLREFFTAGLELDPHIRHPFLSRLEQDCALFLSRWAVPPEWGQGVELKIRRLGQHRAEGIYYPDPPILAVDPRGLGSFTHEFGHHLDFTLSRARGGSGVELGPSAEPDFSPFREIIVERMLSRRGDARCDPLRRAWWGYYTSRAECLARAFEQCTAELLPAPCVLVRERERYLSSPLFLPAVPRALMDWFRGVLARPSAPSLAAVFATRAAAANVAATMASHGERLRSAP